MTKSKSPSGDIDKAAVAVVFGDGVLNGKVFVGRPNGRNAREHFGLDEIDSKSDSFVDVEVPEDIYTITSSFFLGLFGPSVKKAGTRDKFISRFRFNCSDRVWENTIDPGIERALFEPMPLL